MTTFFYGHKSVPHNRWRVVSEDRQQVEDLCRMLDRAAEKTAAMFSKQVQAGQLPMLALATAYNECIMPIRRGYTNLNTVEVRFASWHQLAAILGHEDVSFEALSSLWQKGYLDRA